MKTYLLNFLLITSMCAYTGSIRADNVATGAADVRGTLNVTDYIEGNIAWTEENIDNGFTMKFEVESNGSAFNYWGSSILATGDDAFDGNYYNGFQFYLKSNDNGNYLICKTYGQEHSLNAITNSDASYSITLDYDGIQYTITATDADGNTSTETITNTISYFTTLSYAIPEGVNITKLSITVKDASENSIISPFDAEKKYVLRSTAGTYLKLNDNDDDGNSSAVATAVSYSTTPSVFTITAKRAGYIFKDENDHYIGIASWFSWNISNTTQALWTVEAADDVTDGYYIRCSYGYLGNDDFSVGAGIYNDKVDEVLWYIEEYDESNFLAHLTVSAARYATYYNSEKAYTLPDDCKGYVVKVTDGKLSLNDAYASGSVVPAGEPLIIYSETEGEKTFRFTTSDATTYKTNNENDLEGTDEETALTADVSCYFYALTLDQNNENIGFYWMEDEGAAFTNGAHKAYLKVKKENANDVKGFALDADNATAIEKLTESINAESIIYNLAGQRVSKARKGVYIRNGRKFITK